MPPIPKDGGDAGAIGEPLQIISMDESGTKFDLNMENLAAILGSEPIKGLPAVVVSLAGVSPSALPSHPLTFSTYNPSRLLACRGGAECCSY